MNWVLFFPTFRAVSEVVGDNLAYKILMNLSLIMTIPCLLVFFTQIRIVDGSRFRRWSVALAAGSLAMLAVLVYYFLFTDFGQVTTEMVGNVLAFLTSSPAVFAVFYCLCIPALFGFFLAVFARSAGWMAAHPRARET
jgi:hypothetical protein